MKNDSEGRARYQEFTLPVQGTDGVASTETPTQISLTLDINSLAEDTAPSPADSLLIYRSEDQEHQRLPISGFLSFPPVGLSYTLFETIEPSESRMATWTKHSSAEWIMMLLVGAGGGGGGAGQAGPTSNHSGGGGGGGGGYERTPLLPAELFNASGSLRVGGGGTGGPSGIGAGTNGGRGQDGWPSTIGGLTTNVEITANGGNGGTGATSSSTNAGGGTGGASSAMNGPTNGGGGGAGDYNATSASGGDARWGAGGGGGSGGKQAGVANLPGHGGIARSYVTRQPQRGSSSTVGSGTDGESAVDAFPLLGGSAGGAGGGSTTVAGALGGAGGDGGYPGGGGGAGGAGTNGDGYAGLGGTGEDGLVAVFQFF